MVLESAQVCELSFVQGISQLRNRLTLSGGYGLAAYGVAILQSPKHLFQMPKFAEILQKKRFTPCDSEKKNSAPEKKMQFHTPSHSIPPLESFPIARDEMRGGKVPGPS